MSSTGPTFAAAVPTIWQGLLAHLDANPQDISSLREVIVGGSALPETLARTAIGLGVDIIAGYGMSETCPILTVAHLRPHMFSWQPERHLHYL